MEQVTKTVRKNCSKTGKEDQSSKYVKNVGEPRPQR